MFVDERELVEALLWNRERLREPISFRFTKP